MNARIVEEVNGDILRCNGKHYFSPMQIAQAAYELRHPGPPPDDGRREVGGIGGRCLEAAMRADAGRRVA